MSVELLRRMVRSAAAGVMPAALLVSLASLSGCTGSSNYMKEAPPPTAEPTAGVATVYFLRPSGFGTAINFQIWDRDRFLGLAQSKSYFMVELPPGKHLFMATAENKCAVDAELAAGKRYYLLLGPRMGGFRARVAMTPVKQGSDEWNTVEETRGELHYVVPLQAEIKGWEDAHRDYAQKLITFFESDPEREEYLGHLAASDGR